MYIMRRNSDIGVSYTLQVRLVRQKGMSRAN